jgi:hypothetical protein
VDIFAITMHTRERISHERVEEIDTIAKNIGFHLRSFRSFEKIISPEQISAAACPSSSTIIQIFGGSKWAKQEYWL